MNETAKNEGVLNPAATAILDSMTDGAYVTDTDRRILFWNKAAEQITGWSAEEVVGRCCRDNVLVHVDKDGRELCGGEHCPLHRSIKTGLPTDRPLLVYAQSRRGTRVPVEVTVSPLRDARGTVVGGLELFRDMSRDERDLMRAVLIQRAMLGCGVHDPRVEVETCYLPCEVVGGDLFRVDRAGADDLALLIADVPGHGVAAALFTMVLRSLWEELRDSWFDPGAVLGRMNDRLLPYAGDGGFFATAVAASFDLVGGQARVARAGHPAPFVFSGGAHKAGGQPQLALGMIGGTTYANTAISMNRGDTMLFFTDGAFEVYNPQAMELGLDGLLAMAQALRNERDGALPLAALEDRILRYGGCVRLADDFTLVKLTRR